ncbi:COP9 signalosome, subunit CSN1 [Ceraceosorus bombacis]|uniref:COP9 signalosome, subunit CSN1 n=1 Tax=Ceraceosorus bombacis TaxID=401625 RepID=A0A0P1BP03_9BASI|nr:COP9 signalosome, subunit CSN1 [Ceraceosorus bombacis]
MSASTSTAEHATRHDEQIAHALRGEDAALQTVTPEDDDPFDWESYISAYKGQTQIARLLHLAERSAALRLVCSQAAIALLRQGQDTKQYLYAFRIRDSAGPASGAEHLQRVDHAWVQQVDLENEKELEKLDIELRGYQNNMIKESIRMGHRDLAEHFRATGRMSEALQCYQKTREFCSTSEHVVEMCLGVIEISLELQNYTNVSTWVSKAEGVLETYNPNAAAASSSARKTSGAGALSSSASVASKGGLGSGGDAIGALFRSGGSSTREEMARASTSATSAAARRDQATADRGVKDLAARLSITAALVQLGMGNFEKAARIWLGLPGDVASTRLAATYAHIMSPADIALYTVLSALATFDRRRLKSALVDSAAFAAFLEHSPHSRAILEAFYACDYKGGLQLLQKWKTRHDLDIHLGPHVPTLKMMLITRMMQQFLHSFDSVRVSRVGDAFGWTEAQTLPELIGLVQRGEVEGRVDLRRGVMELEQRDKRQELFEEAIRIGEKRISAAKRLLLRLEMIENGLIVRGTGPTVPRGA